MNPPPDSWIERRPADVYGLTTDDAGTCPNCEKHLDDGCNCTEQEREEGYTLQEREENALADKGEELYQRELERE